MNIHLLYFSYLLISKAWFYYLCTGFPCFFCSYSYCSFLLCIQFEFSLSALDHPAIWQTFVVNSFVLCKFLVSPTVCAAGANSGTDDSIRNCFNYSWGKNDWDFYLWNSKCDCYFPAHSCPLIFLISHTSTEKCFFLL